MVDWTASSAADTTTAATPGGAAEKTHGGKHRAQPFQQFVYPGRFESLGGVGSRGVTAAAVAAAG